MLRKKLIYTDSMAVPDTNVHRSDLDAMRDPSFLHTDLVYQDVFRAKTHWYIWIWHFLTPRGRMLLLIHLAAHFCIIIAIALGATSVIAMALHCRPIKYNYTIGIYLIRWSGTYGFACLTRWQSRSYLRLAYCE
jgi:hypothetical protein